jgi:hypothetical protein
MTAADKLLEVLSCRGSMAMGGGGGFLTAVEELFPEEAARDEKFWRRISSDLIEGGFARRSADGRMEVEHPVLTMLPNAEAQSALLTGARTQKYLDRIEGVVSDQGLDIGIERATDADCFPTRVILRGHVDCLGNLADRMRMRWFATPLAFILVRDHPPVANSLAPGFNHSQFIPGAKWFNPQTLKFDGAPPEGIGTVGLCRFDGKGTKFDVYRVRDGGGGVEALPAADTAAVKWALLGRSFITLAHDKVRRWVAVPRYCPLPTDIGRALALCSGVQPFYSLLSPAEAEKLGFPRVQIEVRVYREVHSIIAHLVSMRVGCQLREVTLNDPATLKSALTT